MKKYSMLATALSLALGSGIASADADIPPTTSQPTRTTTSTELKDITPVDFLFQTNSATLKSTAQADLDQLATWVKCTPKGTLILEGHADPRGTQQHNMELAAQRAATVRQKLVDMGVGADRIVVTIYGENGPKRANYAEDRRVTVRATARQPMPEDIVATR